MAGACRAARAGVVAPPSFPTAQQPAMISVIAAAYSHDVPPSTSVSTGWLGAGRQRALIAAIAAIAVIAAGLASSATKLGAQQAVAITQVTVIDGSSPTPRHGQTVIVQGN